MDPSPPAWLRSYKAHSSIIPNYASQVRPDENGSAMSRTKQEHTPLSSENEKTPEYEHTGSAAATPFTFPSTISLTLHNAGSLDNSYTNSTSASSRQKPTFKRTYDEKSGLAQTTATSTGVSTNRRRTLLCRFLATMRGLLKGKTQGTLAH